MPISKVAVIGGGTMGQGIASLVAQSGFPVIIKDVSKELADKAIESVCRKIDQATYRGKLMQDRAEQAKSLLSVCENDNDLSDADLIIEAVFEEMEVKKKIFQELDGICHKHAIFASNTSSLSITEMVASTKRADRFAGMHFFNPPITMPLIELISGRQTSNTTLSEIENFSASLGKTTIRVKECPGFLVNRLLMPYLNEAVLLLSETILTPEEIDKAATDFGWPMGPFALLDYTGIDIAFHVAKILHQGYGDRAKPAPLMEILARQKRYGKKTGAGFYIYDSSKNFESISEIIEKNFPERRRLGPNAGFLKIMLGMANEAFLCLEEGVSTAEDIEIGCRLGIGFPFAKIGPLHWSEKEMGKKVFTKKELENA